MPINCTLRFTEYWTLRFNQSLLQQFRRGLSPSEEINTQMFTKLQAVFNQFLSKVIITVGDVFMETFVLLMQMFGKIWNRKQTEVGYVLTPVRLLVGWLTCQQNFYKNYSTDYHET